MYDELEALNVHELKKDVDTKRSIDRNAHAQEQIAWSLAI